jgi:hypothetical protein
MANPWDNDEIVAAMPWDADEDVEAAPRPRAPVATSSSAAASRDAGYDYSKLKTRGSGEIPSQDMLPEKPKADPYKGEARNVPQGTVDSVMDWLGGVNNALKASNPTLMGKLAAHVYDSSLERSDMLPEHKDVLDREAAMRKDALLRDTSEVQQFVGEGLGMVLDPAALATQSWGIRSAAGLARTLKMATAGSGYAGAYETLDQLAEEGKITDPSQILMYAAAGAAIPPAIDKAIRVAGRVLDKSMLRSLEKLTTENIKQHKMNHRAAFNHALQEMGLDKGTVSEVLDGQGLQEVYANTIGKWVVGESAAKGALKADNYVDFTKLNNGILSNLKNRTVGAIKNAGTAVMNSMDNLVQPISSGIRKISPEVFGAIRRFEYNTHKDTNAWRSVITPAHKVYEKFSKQDKELFKKAVRNRDTDVAEHLYQKHGGAAGVQAYRAVQGVLDEIYDGLLGTGVDLNYLNNYWPSYWKKGEYDNFLDHMGWEPKSTWERAAKAKALAKGLKADVNNEIARLEKKYNRELTPDEIRHVKEEVKLWERRKIELTEKEKADILNSQLKGITPQGLKTPTAAKSRVIEKVTDDMLPFLEDPFINLYSYIDHSAHTINTRRFFGKHINDGDPNTGADESIGRFVSELLDNGDIRGQDVDRLKKLLNSRFRYSETDPITGRVKNVFYATQLGQFDSALTQLGDLGTAAFVNGLRNTIAGLWKPSIKNALEEVQVRKIAAEFDSTRGAAQQFQNFALKYSGFQHIDGLGKKALIEGALRKNLQAVSRGGKGPKVGPLFGQKGSRNIQEFRAKWEPIFQHETDSLIADLQAGRVTDNVKFLLFNELSDVQPISLLEVPKMYLDNPGGRTFYAMKTFMMKQIDLFRREAVSKILSRNPKDVAEGTTRLIKYGLVVGSTNHTTEQLKNKLAGRDETWDDFHWTTLMKNFGLSSYLVDKMARQTDMEKSPTTPIIEYMLSNPYTAVGETGYNVYDDLKNFADRWPLEYKTIQDMPPFGQMIYNLWGGGVEKIMEQERRKMQSQYTEAYKDMGYDYER